VASQTQAASIEGVAQTSSPQVMTDEENFKYVAEQFADLRILRYRVLGFEQLPAKQKELLYYLYEAKSSGASS
ncbi:MAG: hypothetical protein ACO1NV_10680, partial [Leptospira bouyouniensis]